MSFADEFEIKLGWVKLAVQGMISVIRIEIDESIDFGNHDYDFDECILCQAEQVLKVIEYIKGGDTKEEGKLMLGTIIFMTAEIMSQWIGQYGNVDNDYTIFQINYLKRMCENLLQSVKDAEKMEKEKKKRKKNDEDDVIATDI